MSIIEATYMLMVGIQTGCMIGMFVIAYSVSSKIIKAGEVSDSDK